MTLHEIVGATGAGCASTLIGHPLDTIKVHLQTNPKLSNTLHATQYLLRNNTPLVLFRGIWPPLANAVVMNTVMFSVFHQVKNLLSSEISATYSRALLAGIVSGVATACLSTPTEYVKIQSQIRGIGSASILRQTIRTNPLTLYRGHVANLAREGVFTMVYLGLYDTLMRREADDTGTNNLLKVAAVSSCTGGLAWIASFPFDTVKTVMQGSRTPMTNVQAIRELWSRDGYRAFYRGCGASTGRAVLVTSIRMITYERILKMF